LGHGVSVTGAQCAACKFAAVRAEVALRLARRTAWRLPRRQCHPGGVDRGVLLAVAAGSPPLPLSADQADELKTVAAVDDQPVSAKKVIRAAISAHSAERKKDEVFQQGLRAQIERAQRMLDECQP
jgi:hypothetical protein